MNINRPVIVAVVGITGIGFLSAWVNKRPVTRVIMGGYLLLLILSLADLFGGAMSRVVGAIAMLALLVAFLDEGLPLLDMARMALGNPTPVPDNTPAPVQGGPAQRRQ